MSQFKLALTYREAWLVVSALDQARAGRPRDELALLRGLKMPLLNELREFDRRVDEAETAVLAKAEGGPA